jgi:hypothetical protein
MFIKISKTIDKYCFEIGDNTIDAPESFLSSIKDHCLIPSIPVTFTTFVEAHHYASEIVEGNPTIVLAKKLFFYKRSMEESGIDETHSAINDKILECYGDQLSLIEKRFDEFKKDMELGEYKSEEKQKIWQTLREEISKITDGIEKIANESDFSKDETEQLNNVYFGLIDIIKKIDKISTSENKNVNIIPQAPLEPSPAIPAQMPQEATEGMLAASNNKIVKNANKTLKTEVNANQILKAFGESAVLSINNLHPLSYIKEIYQDNITGDYTVIIAERNENIIGLKFSNSFLLNNIIPLKKEYCRNVYSSSFLEKYWIPITYSVGHFVVDSSVLVPNYNMSHKEICGFNNGKNIIANINIEKEDKGLGIKKSWWIKIAQKNNKKVSDFKQDELINAEVVCIDKGLKTYYSHSGQVLSVIPRDDYIDLVIDFRRGLDKLVLRDDQVDIVKLPS